ncbi:YifB family Mg chelatase-like AAA ATPase [Mariprofundus ferrooxydans]|uniref:Competence protein ComM n=1 Tax=Mariprofundus ferrooxydans PV-1 TaxID=314345 RepID=Q0F3P4_9PROT|nr:YifB family Mg chelatase-like AAA ATPase [Mariprofundus ferrooxydans]EAU55897.1 competence protein ComM [Mariprofundus ferrooxydans PV-1]KON48175.1 ATP-dependent protease [Mariprofundus ferrooxydans]
MLARLHSASLRGLDAEHVDVEVDLSRGLPCWTLVGLGEAAVREARDRVRAAVVNSGFEFPLRRITVNLSPADRRKDGSHFDLPIAIGLLMASGQLNRQEKLALTAEPHQSYQQQADMPFLIGELALDGRLNPVSGVLPLVLFARKHGFHHVIVPAGNEQEAAAIDGMHVYPAPNLLAVVRHIEGSAMLPPASITPDTALLPALSADMADVRGQQQARRVLEIAASGGHHLLMTGSPGVGKSMLAQRLPGIMPPLTREQALEVTRIYSISGDTSRPPMNLQPPLRQPHHSASDVAIIGGGGNPRPGEISKAHFGILFLDELAEHKRIVLETLRQPLEEGKVRIARAADSVVFPARFQLIAAMNPCPCGYLGHPAKACRCSPSEIRRYISRISGPLLDRFDLRIHIPPVDREELSGMQAGENSASIRKRVLNARHIQYHRLGEGCVNARMTTRDIERYARPDAAAAKLLDEAMNRFSLSARSYHRILKVARTIADLAAAEQIDSSHIAEALQYRGEELFDSA